MSSTRYCASCYAGTDYKVSLPVFCSKCGKPFLAAFTQDVPTNPSNTAKIVAKTSPAKVNLEDEETELEIDDDEESDDFDETVVSQKALKFKQALKGMVTVASNDNNGKVRLGDFLNNPDKYSDFGHRQ